MPKGVSIPTALRKKIAKFETSLTNIVQQSFKAGTRASRSMTTAAKQRNQKKFKKLTT